MMCDPNAQFALFLDSWEDIGMNNQTVRYIVAVAALSVVSAVAIVVDGDVGNAIGIAAAGGIGYLAKDWRMAGGEKSEAAKVQ